MKSVRNKVATEAALRQAIQRLQTSGASVTISAVAREASKTPSTIHHVYPNIAEEIRKLGGVDARSKSEKLSSELLSAQATIRELQAEVRQLKLDFAKLASIKYAEMHNARIQDAIKSGNVVEFKPTN